MSLNAFSQAFAGTDWDRLAAVPPALAARAVPHPAMTSATATTLSSSPPPTTGLAAGDAPTKTAANGEQPFLTFNDLIDAINPLQQLPIIDGIYRHYSGDTIRPQGSILGGLIYGGLVGGAIATAMVVVHEIIGVDPEEAVIAYLTGDDEAGGATQVATAQPGATPAASQTPAGTPSSPSSGAPSAPPNTVAVANQAALSQLAADLAGGGQVISNAPAAPGAQTPTSQAIAQAPAQAPGAGPRPLIAGLPGNAPSNPPRLLNSRVVQNNPNPPPPAAFAVRHLGGSYQTAALPAPASASSTPSVSTPNGAPAGAPAAGVGTGAPAGATLAAKTAAAVRPARPPGVVPPTAVNQAMPFTTPAIKPLTNGPEIKPLAAPQSPSVRPLDPAQPITGAPPLPAEPLSPDVVSQMMLTRNPDAVSQMMMRNLDKYQAMARAAARQGPKPVSAVPDV